MQTKTIPKDGFFTKTNQITFYKSVKLDLQKPTFNYYAKRY